jgi:4-alpha-glucanotransferase
MTTAVEQLADHLGVLSSYVDYRGTVRATTDEARLAIIQAMGHAVGSEAEAGELLETLYDEERKRLLDPVLVYQRAKNNVIRVRAPRREGAVHWKVAIRSERGRVATRTGLHEAAGQLDLELPDLGIGYYDVRLELTTKRGETVADQTLIIVPTQCVMPEDLFGDRDGFGVVANLYSVRGARNWGIGDVGDLETLMTWVADIGGSFVGINPLHALLNRGSDISPYGPVSRLWRNPIYIDVERVPEFLDSPELSRRILSPEIEATLSALRERDRVQYDQVAAAKSLALDALFEAFLRRRESEPDHPRVADFTRYELAGGRALTDFATWSAIAESRREWDWRAWPAELQDRQSTAVIRMAATLSKRVDFHRWAQFELDRQLGEVAASGREKGMEIGLYNDMAVGSSGTGADAWAHRDLFRSGATIGAPPDPYSDFGQNWGLPPIDPRALRQDRYRYFIQLARSGFRHAGALRIDHVMGLFRLFWIPEGGSGRDGAYVRYPADDLLGILALESHRSRALVIGEDLGVVPPEVPPAMEEWGLLSSRILYFERENGGRFKPQSSYPRLALASANTHDLPTIAGFWSGRDIELRRSLGLIETVDDLALADRAREKEALVGLLREEGALELHEHVPMDASGVPAVKQAVNAFLCDSPSALVAISLDDLGDETEPVNVPGVGPDKYPCWGRKMRRTIPEIAVTSRDEIDACSSRARPR